MKIRTLLICAVVLLVHSATNAAITISNISSKWYHTLYLQSDGSLWAMGNNANGQIGNGNLTNQFFPVGVVASNVTAISAGVTHSLFQKSDGSLWAMGHNTYGALGAGLATSNRPAPVLIVSSNVAAIAAGNEFSLYSKTDGRSVGHGVAG